jgi:fructuronate reductase
MSELTRSAGALPVRHVHLGLGNFFRAHQAWYSTHAPDAVEWGIAAFTGRRTDRSDALAAALDAQGGLYTLVTRAADGDRFEVVSSLASIHLVDDHEAWLGYLADPQVKVVTTTVTEAGYVRGADGGLDAGRPEVAADVAALRADLTAPVVTAPAKLVAGFAARRAAGAGPLTMVPCDNLPGNGAAVCRVIGDLATLVDPALAAWITANVYYVTTMVDRITPEPTPRRRPVSMTAPPWSPSRSPSGSSAARSPRAGRAGRTPARRSPTTSSRSRTASCGCSTARTRCSPTRAPSGATSPSPTPCATTRVASGSTSGGTRRRST